MTTVAELQAQRASPQANGTAPGGTSHMRWFVRGSAFAAAAMVLNGGLTLITAMVFARWLGPVAFGTYSVAFVLLTLLGGLGAAGMDTAVARFVALYNGSEQAELIGPVLRFGLRRAALVSLVLGVSFYIALAGGVWLPERLDSIRAVAPMIGFGIPFVALSLVLMQATLHFGAIKARMVFEKVGQPLLRLAVPFAFVFVMKNRLLAAIAGLIAAAFFCGLACAAVLQRVIPGRRQQVALAREYPKIWSRYALPFMFQSFQQFVSSGLGIEVVLVGAMLSVSDAGMYTAAFRFMPLLVITRSAMDYAFGPKVGTLFGSQDYESIRSLYKASASIGLFMTLPAGIIFLLFSRQLLAVFFGASYIEAGAALAWLVAGCVIDSATGCNTTLLTMSGRSWLVLANNMVGGILTVLLCLLLIPRFGITGAAFSVSSARLLSNALATVELWLLFRWQPFGGLTAKLSALAAPTFGVGVWVRQQVQPHLVNPLLYLIFASAVVLVAYGIGIRLSGVRWKSFWRSPYDPVCV
jgi:O-antigen/teichoic acid export membrane protein